MQILKVLGFEPGTLDDYTVKARGTCCDYYCVGRKRRTLGSESSDHTPGLDDGIPGPESDEDSAADLMKESRDYGSEHHVQSRVNKERRAKGQYIHYGSASNRTDSEKTLSRLENYMQSNSTRFPPPRRGVDEDGHGRCGLTFMMRPATMHEHICRAIINAVDIAAKLAFSDWDTSIKLLSVRYFHQAGSKIACTYESDEWNDEFKPKPSVFHGHLESAVQLCTDVFETATLEKHVIPLDWAGVDLDGIVVLRSSVAHRSITDLRGRYLEFRPGRIKYEDLLVRSIRVDIISLETYKDRALHLRRDKEEDRSETVGPELSPQCTPDLDPMEFRCSFTMIGRTLLLKLECLTNKKRWIQVDPIEISNSIPKLFVTVSCTHAFRTPLVLHGTAQERTNSPRFTNELYDDVGCWLQDSAFDTPELVGPAVRYTLGGRNIAYLHVDQSAEGQWLSCRTAHVRGLGPDDSICGYTVLQKNTCLLCTMHAVFMGVHQLMQVRIIPYGDDVIENTVSHSSTPSFRSCQNFQSLSLHIRRRYLTSVHEDKEMKSKPILKALSNTRINRTCPGSLHTSCCVESRANPCIVCVPDICQDDLKRPPCGSCKGMYLVYSDYIKEIEAEWKTIGEDIKANSDRLILKKKKEEEDWIQFLMRWKFRT